MDRSWFSCLVWFFVILMTVPSFPVSGWTVLSGNSCHSFVRSTWTPDRREPCSHSQLSILISEGLQSYHLRLCCSKATYSFKGLNFCRCYSYDSLINRHGTIFTRFVPSVRFQVWILNKNVLSFRTCVRLERLWHTKILPPGHTLLYLPMWRPVISIKTP